MDIVQNGQVDLYAFSRPACHPPFRCGGTTLTDMWAPYSGGRMSVGESAGKTRPPFRRRFVGCWPKNPACVHTSKLMALTWLQRPRDCLISILGILEWVWPPTMIAKQRQFSKLTSEPCARNPEESNETFDRVIRGWYCSITVVNHRLITVIRFVAKNYTNFF